LEPVRLSLLVVLASFWAVPLPGRAEPSASGGSFTVQGLLLPAAQAKLASRAKGVIESIKREGDAVKEGEVVMELENTMEGLQLDQQRHILDLRAFERAASDELSQKSVISKTEVEEKRVNHEVAKVQLEIAGRLLHMRKVEAPFEGVIAERLRERGEAVDEFTPVVTLVKLDKLYLEVFLPAGRLREVKVGRPVTVTVEDLPGRTFAGEVAEVSPAVNPASGEFKVRVLVPNAQGELVAGTPAVATFVTEG
jgi:membrane fusion protein (multidrug efflux system)